MDLCGNDDWIFDDLEFNNNNAENIKPSSSNPRKEVVKKVSVTNDEIALLKQKLHDYELKEKSNDAGKSVFIHNFYQLLITARNQINKLETKNRELEQRLKSHSTVKCPKCENCFRSGDSRLLPSYVRYLKACNRLELDFNNKEELKQWLVLSNLDTDSQGLPVIQINEKTAKTLKDSGSLLMNEEKLKNDKLLEKPVKKAKEEPKREELKREEPKREELKREEQQRYRLEVDNLSSRISIKELKDMFNKTGKVVDAYLHETEKNKAVVYFNYHNHLIRVIDKFHNKELNGRRIKLTDRSKPSKKEETKRTKR